MEQNAQVQPIAVLKCMHNRFNYQYEYIGSAYRLIITPLIYKCTMTILNAFSICLGVDISGPAGVGKTELMKDLARSLATNVIVFNCSEEVSTQTLTRFFKGIASSGIWCCLDEFNRTQIDVISIVSSQLFVLISEKINKSTRIEFEGSELRLT